MADPMKPDFTAQNPIVEAAERLRTRRALDDVIGNLDAAQPAPEDAEQSMTALVKRLNEGATRLNSVVGRARVKIVVLARPPRIRIRFDDKRIALDLDQVHQLVQIRGCGLDGEYQFDLSAAVPALIDVSKLSTREGYGDAVTASSLLRAISRDAELPRPSHLDGSGPLTF